MKASEFIAALAQITGQKVDTFKPFLDSLSAIDIPDELQKGINENILTFESAKSNTKLINHFHATALNGVDDHMKRFMTDRKLDQKTIDKILAGDTTAKRTVLLAQELETAKEAAINATGGDKKVLADKIEAQQAEIATLNGQIVTEREGRETALAEAKTTMTNQLRDYQIDGHFRSYDYANERIKKDVHVITAKTLTDAEMKRLELKTAFDEKTGKVQLLTSKDQPYFKDNKPVDWETFTNSLLADNGLLKASDGGNGNGAQPIVIGGHQNNGGGAGQTINSSKMTAALQRSADSLTANSN